MKALILAAGYATRLYPLTKDFPKALLEVGHQPIINYIVQKLQDVEAVNEIIVITNSKFYRLFKAWALKIPCSKRITILDDLTSDVATKRGAIGDLHFAINKKKINEDLLVIGGDNLFADSLEAFLACAHKKKNHPVIGAYDIKDRKAAQHYGVIQLNSLKRVVSFQEKPKQPRSTLVAMCLYYFPKKKVNLVQQYVNEHQGRADAVGLYIDWLCQVESVYGHVFSDRWYDIGDHAFYNKAKHSFSGDTSHTITKS